MIKELVISICIVILVFVGNGITQNYTKASIDEASNRLNELKEKLVQEDNDTNYLNNEIEDIISKWNNRHKNLAYYIEHDELEKVETDFSGLKGYIRMEEYSEAVAELERTVYVLEHIKNKNVFNLQNIF